MPLSSATLQLWEYRDTAAATSPASDPVEPIPNIPTLAPVPGLTEEQAEARVASALAEAEQRWAAQVDEHEKRNREELRAALQSFAAERARYFRDIEVEVVQLALSIARKILGREANLDPELLIGLVRTALDRVGAGTAVKVRVCPGELTRWQNAQDFRGGSFKVEIATDESLQPGDCLLETDLGTAHFGLNSQLKEIEEGMLDLLRRRPLPDVGGLAEAASEAAGRPG